ncbi:hypothetical protein DL770_005572 [Monosporascus sp. CRB-9-2]|nr:hypothetical protein DL770_005572 [Monosporascus sp. CRB-9-2]
MLSERIPDFPKRFDRHSGFRGEFDARSEANLWNGLSHVARSPSDYDHQAYERYLRNKWRCSDVMPDSFDPKKLELKRRALFSTRNKEKAHSITEEPEAPKAGPPVSEETTPSAEPQAPLGLPFPASRDGLAESALSVAKSWDSDEQVLDGYESEATASDALTERGARTRRCANTFSSSGATTGEPLERKPTPRIRAGSKPPLSKSAYANCGVSCADANCSVKERRVIRPQRIDTHQMEELPCAATEDIAMRIASDVVKNQDGKNDLTERIKTPEDSKAIVDISWKYCGEGSPRKKRSARTACKIVHPRGWQVSSQLVKPIRALVQTEVRRTLEMGGLNVSPRPNGWARISDGKSGQMNDEFMVHGDGSFKGIMPLDHWVDFPVSSPPPPLYPLPVTKVPDFLASDFALARGASSLVRYQLTTLGSGRSLSPFYYDSGSVIQKTLDQVEPFNGSHAIQLDWTDDGSPCWFNLRPNTSAGYGSNSVQWNYELSQRSLTTLGPELLSTTASESPSATPSSTTSPVTTSLSTIPTPAGTDAASSPPAADTGLNTGAQAGIGIGIGLGGLGLGAVAAFWFMRRRKTAAPVSGPDSTTASAPYDHGYDHHQGGPGYGPSPASHHDPVKAPPEMAYTSVPQEMADTAMPQELGAEGHPVELPATFDRR